MSKKPEFTSERYESAVRAARRYESAVRAAREAASLAIRVGNMEIRRWSPSADAIRETERVARDEMAGASAEMAALTAFSPRDEQEEAEAFLAARDGRVAAFEAFDRRVAAAELGHARRSGKVSR